MKWMHLCLLLTFLILTACSDNAAYREQREATPDLMQYFHSDTCKKLKTVIEYGYDKVDQGHFTLLIPGWIKTNFHEDIAKDDVVECSVNLYDQLVETMDDPHRVEKIETLLYFMIELKYQREPEISKIFREAVCKDSLFNESGLIDIYYYDLTNTYPDFKTKPKEIIHLICLMTGG